MAKKLKKDAVIEGKNAYMYANLTKSDLESYKQLAEKISKNIKDGQSVLEIAFGAGYTIIELAKLGNYLIFGMDLSFAFVEIGKKNAQEAGVNINFRQGNVSNMPFENETFDLIVNRAAFKNFQKPVGALNEMYRILKPNGKILIEDLKPNISFASINFYVNNMKLNFFNKSITKAIFYFGLRNTAHSKKELVSFISQTEFKDYNIEENTLGYEVWLQK